MRQKLLFKICVIAMLVGLFSTSAAFGQAVLMHSYTFDDGTADDVVGGAHGTVVGGTMSDGAYIAENDGYIELDAATIAINTYSAITIEAYVLGSENAATNAMLYYLGGSLDNFGSNGTFLTPIHWREGTLAGISTGNVTSPWNAETYVLETNYSLSVPGKHHTAVVINSTDIKLYLDGAFIAATDLATQGNSIAGLSNDFAWIGRGGYTNDPKWSGSIDKFNIYEGELSASVILDQATTFTGIDPSDATLSEITTNTGTLDPVFDSATFSYAINVDWGITSLIIGATPNVDGAAMTMESGLGDEIIDGVVGFELGEDGIDMEITITSLNSSNTEIYQVSIDVNPGEESANLSSFDLSVGSLLNDFHPDTLEYTALLPFGTTSVDVTANAAWAGAEVEGDGEIDLSQGTDTITVIVTSEDGNATKSYSLILYVSQVGPGQSYYFVHETSGFVFAEGDNASLQLQYPLKDSTHQLFQIEESGVPGQYFLKSEEDRYVRLDDITAFDLPLTDVLTTDLDSCRFILIEFEPGRFLIESVAKSAEEGKYMGTNNNDIYGGVFSDKRINADDPYRFWNIKLPADVVSPYNTNLSDLTIDAGELHPTFDFFIDEYYVVVPEGTTTLNVGATPQDATSTVTNGTGAINVSDGAGTITVTVTGYDQEYTQDYKIHYLVNTAPVLKHSYTFEDGTAQDQAGEAHGTVFGDSVSIAQGLFTSVAEGDYITLPGDVLQLSSYPSITLEAYIATNGSNIGKFAMIAYFGGDGGTNAFWMQTTRADGSGESVAGANFIKTSGPECDDVDGNYHLVGVLTYDTLYYYINGVFQSKVPVFDVLRKIPTNNALIGESGYNDPSWIGSIYEFNIYSGEMDAQTVATRSALFPIEDSASDATLSDLMIDGATIEGFKSYTLDYVVEFPLGTTSAPAVTATAKYANAGAVAVVTDATTVPDTAKVEVTAEDGDTKVIYNVIYKFEPSSEAKLSDLTVDGTQIEGFDADVTEYVYYLPLGTTTVPTVNATSEGEATIVIDDTEEIPGSTTIEVTSEDGSTTETYSITFTYVGYDDATLSNLTVAGTTIAEFDPTKIIYVYRVSRETTTVPTVTATANNTDASVVITPADLIPGATNIVVTAIDGVTTKLYVVNFDFNTSVENPEESIVDVYPTFFKDNFNIVATEAIDAVTVHDITGKIVYQSVSKERTHTVSVDNAGMYIVNVESNGVSTIYKVFKTN